MKALLAGIAQGRLLGGVCKRCGHHVFPPREMCPKCFGEVELVEVPKVGEVITYSEVHVSTGRFPTPYFVAIVKFGRFQIPGYVVEPVEIGDKVEWFITNVGGRTWYAFRKVKS